MTAADVPAATAALIAADFGDRGTWLAFATKHSACRPVVAELDGAIVGTGVGTANGTVGWLATIWVDPGHRRAGLGRALTEALIDDLDVSGCRTFVLVATDAGRRLYERMGFEVQTRYQILEAPGPAHESGVDPDVRPFAARDLQAILNLDRAATGEDRRHAIELFASPTSAMVLRDEGGVRGFVIRAHWGGGATIARSATDSLRLLDARRLIGSRSGRVRAGLLDANQAGLAALEGRGFRRIWSAPRMIRGAPLEWHPDWIWGQFNHAIG